MPKYLCDFADGETRVRDEAGIELPDLDTVRREARLVSVDVVRTRMPVGERVFTVTVRDARNLYPHREETTIEGERL